MNEQSLDSTLKEIIEDTSAESSANDTADKPKRTRRTKAQIEADKKAAELASNNSEESTSENLDSSSNSPEVIPDTQLDNEPDVVESTVIAVEDPAHEDDMIPEVVADTETDALPDVVEPKVKVVKRTRPSSEAIEAFQDSQINNDPNSLIGRSFVLTSLTPVYRARHLSMRIKPYMGAITVTEDSKQGFTKIQFLRSGFGMCEGYIESDSIPANQEGEDDVIAEESKEK